MQKIAVMGCSGRMGVEVARAVLSTDGVELAGCTEAKGHQAVGADSLALIGEGSGGPAISDDLGKIISEVDAVIDFTAPTAAMNHFDIAADNGKAIVIGTTGFSAEEMERIKARSAEVRCVLAPNMSVGVNLMFKLVSEAARIIGSDYDIEIMEIHHNRKKDAPSGTAARLAEICARETGRNIEKAGVYGREGLTGERRKDEIGVMSLRAGDVVGEHTVIFGGTGERLEIAHKAGSRSNFARGAVLAAIWLADKKPGIYDMQDVLGLK